MRHTSLNLLFSLVFLAVGCGGEIPDPLAPQNFPPDSEVAAAPGQLVTVVERPSLVVGDTAVARCYEKRDGELFLTEDPVAFEVTPDAGPVAQDGLRASFTPTRAAVYTVRCVAADGSRADPSGAQVTVARAAAVSWTADIPVGDCVAAHQALPIEVEVIDALGDVIDDPAVSAEVSPQGGVLGSVGTGLRLIEEGTYSITLRYDGPTDGALEPEQFEVRVDATPPEIRVDTPAAGAMVEGSGPVTVQGTASDAASDLASLQVAGEPRSVDGGAQFEAQVATRWGMNLVTVRAEDACGNVAHASRAFLVSGSYAEAATGFHDGAVLREGMSAALGQQLIDDGDRSDLDDMMTLAETVMAGVDPNAMLAPGAVLADKEARACDGCPTGPNFVSVGFTARRQNDASKPLILEGPWMDELSFAAGGMSMGLTVGRFSLPLSVDVDIHQCALGCNTDDHFTVNSTVGFESLEVSGRVGLDVVDGVAEAQVDEMVIDVTGAFFEPECGGFQWACDEITPRIIDAAEEKVEALISDKVKEALEPMLEDALSGLSMQRFVELPAPLSGELGVAGGLERLTMCGPSGGWPVPAGCAVQGDGMGMALWTQVVPVNRGSGIDPSARGAVLLEQAPAPLNAGDGFSVGVRTDLINQALWSLWYAGGLRVDLGELLDGTMSGVSGSLEATLPPVVMPGENGNPVELGLGDLRLEATVDVGGLLGGEEAEPHLIDIVVRVSAVIGAAIDVDPETKQLRIVADPEPEFDFAIEQIGDHTYGSVLGAELGAAVSEQLPALLNESLGAIEMPRFDLGTIQGVPAGTIWGMTEMGLTHQNGQVVLNGNLGQVAP